MSLQQLYMTLLVGGLVVLVSIVATRVASRLGLPSLLLFLALGVVLGEDVLGIEFNDAQLAQNLGTAALAVILIDGGLTTDWSDIRSVIAPAGVLASAGVGMSTAVTAVGAHYLLAMGWQQAVLLGAILASTDAAAVFSVLRVLPLPRRVAGLLEAESGFNDAPSVVLVLLFSTTPFHLSAPAFVGTLLYELAAGVAIGVALGWLGAIALRRIALPASGLYPLATFGLGIVAFAAGGAAHASGFLAAYLAALILANTGLPHRAATRSFAEGLGWLARSVCSSCSGCSSPLTGCHSRSCPRSLSDWSCCLPPGRWPSSVPCSSSGSQSGSRRSCPGQGFAVPCRSCSPHFRSCAAYPTATGCWTSFSSSW